MFIEKALEGSTGGADDGQNGEMKDRLSCKLQSILAVCESLEVELAEEMSCRTVPREVEDLSKRVGVVRALAEAMLGGVGR